MSGSPAMPALVLGAAGFLGLNLLDVMSAVGIRPRCGRRARTNVIPLRRRAVPLVHADLDDPRTLRAAMAGVRVVYHLAGHYPRLSLHREAALRTGLSQLRAVLQTAGAAGVERLVYVSSTATVAANPTGRASDESHTFASAPGFGVYHDLKWHMEETARREAECEVVIACPGACLGPFDYRLGTAGMIAAVARGADPPHPDGIVNLVDVRDVARALVALGTTADVPSRVLLVGRNQRLARFLAQLAERYGVAPLSGSLSAETARALADLEETRVAGTVERPRLSREIVDLVTHAVPVETQLAERALGIRWTPLSDTLDAFDHFARRMRFIPRTAGQTLERTL